MTASQEHLWLAAEVAAVHASSPRGTWEVAAELLPAAAPLADRRNTVDPHDLRAIMAGIGILARHGPHPTVDLYTTRQGMAHSHTLPAWLRPQCLSGPPEEDVFVLTLASTDDGNGNFWPDRRADPVQVASVVQALHGPVSCRTRVLVAVAVRCLLRLLHAEPSRLRWVVRRLVWLVDASVQTPAELFLGLTGTEDPLVRLDINVAVDERDGSSVSATWETFPVAGWEAWPAVEGQHRLAGRLQVVRRHRRTTFVDLVWKGSSAQLAVPPLSASHLRAGDLVVATGAAGTTGSGTPTLFVDTVEEHQSSLVGLPPVTDLDDQWAYSELLGRLRAHMVTHQFREVATPILSAAYLGGTSRPFSTWLASRNAVRYLRVTTELSLLQFLAGGQNRCYEIGPSFRNEGLRGESVKEFLMLEAYAVDLDLDGMIALVAELLADVLGDRRALRRVRFDDAFLNLSGVPVDDVTGLRRLAEKHAPATVNRTTDPEALARRLWEGTFRQRLEGFAAVEAIPGDGSPLIRGHGRAAERVWLNVDGVEVAEVARNERNVIDLQKRLQQQFDNDRYAVHRDYREALTAFALGVPPCVGVGIGLGRLVRLLQERSPQVRPVTMHPRFPRRPPDEDL